MRRLPALASLLVIALFLPATASAQTVGSVTLDASASRVTIGESVELSGRISPPSGGQTVQVVDSSEAVVGAAATDEAGRFALDVEPEGTRTYRAAWGTVTSTGVRVQVRALVAVKMSAVRLFGAVMIRGTVDPARAGARVDVALVQGGRVVEERRVAMGASGGFRASFHASLPGTYRAKASFSDADLARDTATTGPRSTPMPTLRVGSQGPSVRLLEQRLVELHYRLTGATDGRFDVRTADAVVAFHKVQGMSRTFTVDAATWRALADPRIPRPAQAWRGLHVEVDQTRQVLYTVEDGEITNILHVSSGKPSTPTRDGIFAVTRKIAGFSPNHLYYPSYFDGERALHGWTDVPTYAASHGCVRIPYWNAIWVYGLAGVGTRVVVYH
jgi:lipoprotein-anchoring transpeptidase ErfK/SrfK